MPLPPLRDISPILRDSRQLRLRRRRHFDIIASPPLTLRRFFAFDAMPLLLLIIIDCCRHAAIIDTLIFIRELSLSHIRQRTIFSRQPPADTEAGQPPLPLIRFSAPAFSWPAG
jgi:hypothetical protein